MRCGFINIENTSLEDLIRSHFSIVNQDVLPPHTISDRHRRGRRRRRKGGSDGDEVEKGEGGSTKKKRRTSGGDEGGS